MANWNEGKKLRTGKERLCGRERHEHLYSTHGTQQGDERREDAVKIFFSFIRAFDL